MKTKVSALAGAAAVVAVLAAALAYTDTPPQTRYEESNLQIREALAQEQISMSAPINLSTQDLIEQFCYPFIDEANPVLSQEESMGHIIISSASAGRNVPIQYCTSTEIVGTAEEFLGNVHMAGSPDEPTIAIGAIQVSHTQSFEYMAAVFESMVQVLACDCWEEAQTLSMPPAWDTEGGSVGDWQAEPDRIPDRYESLYDMIWDINTRHQQSELAEPLTVSNIIELEGRMIQIILLPNPQGIEWQMRIVL